MKRISFIIALAISIQGASLVRAQTNNSYPMLMSLKPVAVQIGETTECEVTARYTLVGAYKVLVSGEGVTAEVVPPEKPPEAKPNEAKPSVLKTKLKFTVAADAIPGIRDFRVITPQGASTVGQVVIARDPIETETATGGGRGGRRSRSGGDSSTSGATSTAATTNNTIDKAESIEIPATVCGTIESAEDVDCYKFKLDAPTALTFSVRSRRMMYRYHDMQLQVDPIITIRNAMGSTLATSDNYFAGDPLLHYKFEQPGEYILEIRDVRYQGRDEWVYAVEVNSRPYVTQAYPLSVAPGAENKLSLVGFNLPADPTIALNIPADAPAGLRQVSSVVAGQPANDFGVVVTKLPPVTEGLLENNAIATAQAISLPAAINGRIESAGDIDCFVFEAKKGETWSFDVIARRAMSGLDPIIRILNDKGAALIENDDARVNRVNVSDSWIENWSAPADGKYVLEIRDLHLRGGAEFPYVVLASRSQPYFELELDSDKTLLAPGISAPFYVRVNRKNGFAGEVQLAVNGLPPGVTATTGRILASGNDGCIILTAAPDAPAAAVNIQVTGTATHPGPDGAALALSAVAIPLQEYYSPGGGRGNWPVEMHTVSVAEPMDVRTVKLSATDITLKPGDSQKIDVTIERAPGFKGNVTLDVLFQHLTQPYGNSLPKGVTLDGNKSKTLLTGEETKGTITLVAAKDASPVEKQVIPVMAHISINFVMKHTLCGPPVTITVEAPAK